MLGRTVEILVGLPVLRTFYTTTLQPVCLDPIYQVLLVGVISIVNDESAEAVGGLLLEPVFEDETQHSGGHLQEKQQRQGYRIKRQETGVLPQGAHAPREPDDERDGADDDEEERGVHGYMCHPAEIVERVLLRPRPNANTQDEEAENPKYNIEAEYNILHTAADFGPISSVAVVRHV